MSDLFPNNWQVSNLNDLGQSYSGLKSKSKKDFEENGDASFVTYRNINRNYFVDKLDLAPVHVQSTENQNVVKKGDVLFTGSSETPDEVAISSVMAIEIDNLYLNSFCFGYRFNDVSTTLPDFYAYYFRGDNFRKTVLPLAQGSTRYNISKNELLKVEVPIPSKTEQIKIAAILSSVDEAIEKTEQIIEQTETVKKGLLKQLLTKGLNHKKFKDSPIGSIPNEWSTTQLKNISFKITDGTHKTPKYTESGIPFLRVTDLKNQKIDFKNTKYISEEEHKELTKRCYPEKGDILLSKNGTIGLTKVIDWDQEFSIFVSLALIKLKQDIVLPKFIEYFLQSEVVWQQLRRRSKQGTVTNLHLVEIKELICGVPSIDEQEKIINKVNSIERKIENEKDKLIKLKDLKKGLMQQLLTGKVRVPFDEKEEVPS